jgi:hypothetical protein
MKALKSISCAALVIVLCYSHAFSQSTVSYTIHWAPPTDPNASQVVVYRSLDTTPRNFVPVGTKAVAETSLVDAGGSLAFDVKYRYSLRSQTAAGTLGAYSAEVSGLMISEYASEALKSLCRIDSVKTIDTVTCRVYWSTSAASTGKLRYWRSGQTTVLEGGATATPGTHHEAVLGSLVKDAVYFVRAVSHDGTGSSLTISAPQSFTTSPPVSNYEIVSSADSVVVPEGGTAGLGLKLSAQPSAAVEVTVERSSGDGDITIQSGAVLTFSTSDWNTYQTVTFAAAADADADKGVATFIAHVTAGGSAPVKTLKAIERDDDALNFVLDADTLVVPEAGTARFHVRLASMPAANVQASVTRPIGDADITVQSGASLVFTPSNWSTDQTVTLAAAADQDIVDGIAAIRVRATSGPAVPDAVLYVLEDDDDVLRFVLDADTLVVPEAGTAQFHVRLSNIPPEDVTVSVSRSAGDGDITVHSSGTLVFTAANWSVDQTVTLAAATDQDIVDGSATIRVRATSGPSIADATLLAKEDDGGVLFFAVDLDTLVVPEGGTAQFNVRLTSEPPASVNVLVSRLSGDGDITIASGSVLVFTAGDWNVDQTVTLAAAEDADSDDGTATILVHVVSGPSVPDAALPAREDDNDPIHDGHDENSTAVLVVSYPMPYRPDRGELNITNLPLEGSLDIYDLGGRRVWDASWSGRSEITWSGVNNQASIVASGRYFMVVRDASGHAVDKQAILVVR